MTPSTLVSVEYDGLAFLSALSYLYSVICALFHLLLFLRLVNSCSHEILCLAAPLMSTAETCNLLPFFDLPNLARCKLTSTAVISHNLFTRGLTN